jgi:glycosyltransferase involved in cell wall biosynthesis
MNISMASDQPVVVLIGNYPEDRQESMLRFRDLIQSRLEADGYSVESIFPRAFLGRLARKGAVAKWLAYLDKYVFFPLGLGRQLAGVKRNFPGRKVVVHICDHSNAVYAAQSRRWFPVLVTCHDLLAVRGALGEDTDCPASGFGKLLQFAILRGLRKANLVVCVSRATQDDLVRLAGPDLGSRSQIIPLTINYPYRTLPQKDALEILAQASINLPYQGFILHVGSGLRRKNRQALFLAVAQIKDSWPGQIAFAGERLSVEEWNLARSLGVENRVFEIARPDNIVLQALYSAAHCLVFMSRFEGFGWPLLEAQASGCPVICSNRTSVPEVAGEGALIHEPDDYAGIARDIQRLEEASFRENMIALGFKNAQGYTDERMMRAYQDIYRRIE